MSGRRNRRDEENAQKTKAIASCRPSGSKSAGRWLIGCQADFAITGSASILG